MVGICSLVSLFIRFTAPFNAWRNRRQLGSPICCDRPSHSLWRIPAQWPGEANDIALCYEIAVLSWLSGTVLWTPRPQDTPAKGSRTRRVWGTPSSPQRPWSHGCPGSGSLNLLPLSPFIPPHTPLQTSPSCSSAWLDNSGSSVSLLSSGFSDSEACSSGFYLVCGLGQVM